MTYLITVGLLLLLVVLIANRNTLPRQLEPARHWREVSPQDCRDLDDPSLRRAIRYKLRILKGLDTVILVWGARIATPVLFVACASSLLEEHLSVLGESWSIALQLSLIVAGGAFAYFAMPATVRGKQQIRKILLTVVSIGLVIVLGLWNVMGVSIHFAKVSYV